MTIFAHVGGGIVVAAAVQNLILQDEITPGTLIAGVILGILPDLDGIFALVLGKWTPGVEQLSHHRLFTHTPVFYLVLSGIIWFWMGWKWALIFFVLTLTHLLFDSWSTDDGIMWLWPFQKKQYSLFTKDIHAGLFGWQFYLNYLKTPQLILPEIALILGGVTVVICILIKNL